MYNAKQSVSLKLSPKCDKVVMYVPLHAHVRLPQEELVKVERRRPVSIEPHCVASRLPQLVPHRAGDKWECEAVHLVTTRPAQRSWYLSI